MVPIYPEFKKITLEDRILFEPLEKFDSYSDFNLMSLLSWNLSNTNEFSVICERNIVLKMKDYLSDKKIYSVLGSNDLDSTLITLLDDFGELNLIPEIVVNNISTDLKSKLEVTEDRDSFDYIISLQKLARLDGSDVKQLRRYVRNFEEEFPNLTFRTLDLADQKDENHILNLTKNWVIQKGYDTSKVTEELAITKNFLKHAMHFNTVALGIFIKEKLIAFTLNEILSPTLIMGHFGKSDNTYKHSSYFMEYLNAKYFFEQGFLYLNHQQDTGLLGLRTAKMTYAPVNFLKKYTITKKEN